MEHYSILGLAKDANVEDIKIAYKKLALMYHPDKNSDVNANEKFSSIETSYKILSDPYLRTIYDLGKLDAYLSMKNNILPNLTEENVNKFSTFIGDKITTTYTKKELLCDLNDKNLDKIVAITL